MGNHESKKFAAERHNARYAARCAEAPKPRLKPVKPKAVNVGAIGHVDQDKKTLTKAINQTPKKPKRGAWWRKYALPDVCWLLLAAGAFSGFSYWGLHL